MYADAVYVCCSWLDETLLSLFRTLSSGRIVLNCARIATLTSISSEI